MNISARSLLAAFMWGVVMSVLSNLFLDLSRKEYWIMVGIALASDTVHRLIKEWNV